jgi:hypothetical protein
VLLATLPPDREELVHRNDGHLAELIRSDDVDVERETERIIAGQQPIIDAILAHYTRTRLLGPEDAEDVSANVHLRLVLKLRCIPTDLGEAILSLRGYVARLTYNAVSDFLRKRYPERTRLKARLRYTLTTDERFALWPANIGPVCGLAAWSGRDEALEQLPQRAVSIAAAIAPGEAATALAQIFRAVERPVLFEATVNTIAEAWRVIDTPTPTVEEVGRVDSDEQRLEDLDFARVLWLEIQLLPAMQRRALLLNLRYGSDANIVSLLVLARIARFDEIAAALELTRAELSSIWNALPMEDAKIAERFSITRQQVINLRKSARARLSRRLRR